MVIFAYDFIHIPRNETGLLMRGPGFGLRSFQLASAGQHSNNCWMGTMGCYWFWLRI